MQNKTREKLEQASDIWTALDAARGNLRRLRDLLVTNAVITELDHAAADDVLRWRQATSVGSPRKARLLWSLPPRISAEQDIVE